MIIPKKQNFKVVPGPKNALFKLFHENLAILVIFTAKAIEK